MATKGGEASKGGDTSNGQSGIRHLTPMYMSVHLKSVSTNSLHSLLCKVII